MSAEQFPVWSWPDLEKICGAECECGHCHTRFNEDNPPEITARCHQGPVYLAYWDGWILLRCGVCRAPIAKIEIHKSLL